eukprot:scaffold70778_cov75-Phaeocystis_antarctica.AAC.1
MPDLDIPPKGGRRAAAATTATTAATAAAGRVEHAAEKPDGLTGQHTNQVVPAPAGRAIASIATRRCLPSTVSSLNESRHSLSS